MRIFKEGFSIPLLIIIVVLLGVGGYVGYKKYSQQKSASTMETKQSLFATEERAWRTYTDRQHNFTFQYPLGWSVCKNASEEVELVTVSDDCASVRDVPYAHPINYFIVRFIGDLDAQHLASETLKQDTGWKDSQSGVNKSRDIYFTPQNINISLNGKSDTKKTLEDIASTFSFEIYRQNYFPAITGGSFDVATGATFDGRITLIGNNFDKPLKVIYEVAGYKRETLVTANISSDGKQLQFILPANHMNGKSVTAWIQTDWGLSNKIIIELSAKGGSYQLI